MLNSVQTQSTIILWKEKLILFVIKTFQSYIEGEVRKQELNQMSVN